MILTLLLAGCLSMPVLNQIVQRAFTTGDNEFEVVSLRYLRGGDHRYITVHGLDEFHYWQVDFIREDWKRVGTLDVIDQWFVVAPSGLASHRKLTEEHGTGRIVGEETLPTSGANDVLCSVVDVFR